MQTVKSLCRKATDKQFALLDYRTTPQHGVNLSPAQLLMGRGPRNKLPSLRELLTPTAYNRQDVMQRLDHQKANLKIYHDSKSARDLPPLCPGDQVRMAPSPGSKMWNPAMVVEHTRNPVAAHQANNRNLRQPLELKPLGQMNRTQLEVVAQFATHKDLTCRVTSRLLYNNVYNACGFKNTVVSAISQIPYYC